MLVRKKPVVVQAHRMAPLVQSMERMPKWLRAALNEGQVVLRGDYGEVKTLEGVMRFNEGDWVIRGVKGELYACKHDIFNDTYDIIGEEP